jgi:hypothetical protein
MSGSNPDPRRLLQHYRHISELVARESEFRYQGESGRVAMRRSLPLMTDTVAKGH